MRKRVVRRKPFVVDGQAYEVSVTATYEKVVNLRVTIQANFGNRSVCIINGLRNFDYWYNYGYWNDGDYSESTDKVTITPRMIAALIVHARQNGWFPEASKSNHSINIANADAKSIADMYNASDRDAAPAHSNLTNNQSDSRGVTGA